MDARHVLRRLLRQVHRHITSTSGNKQCSKSVVEEFRRSAGLSPERQQRLLVTAQNYELLIANVAKHKALLNKFNIGRSEEDRNREMVRATARRVGFDLPNKT